MATTLFPTGPTSPWPGYNPFTYRDPENWHYILLAQNMMYRAMIQATPNPLEFFGIPGQSYTKELVIQNVGVRNLVIRSLLLDGLCFGLLEDPPKILAPGAQFSLSVEFFPDAWNKTYTGTITIVSNSKGGDLHVALTGNSVALGQLFFDPDPMTVYLDIGGGSLVFDPNPILLSLDIGTPVEILPSAPLNILATAGDGTASVQFLPPVNADVSGVNSYRVISYPGNMVASGTNSPIVVSGLTNGVSYTFKVVALGTHGSGVLSEPSNPAVPHSDAPVGVVSYLTADGGVLKDESGADFVFKCINWFGFEQIFLPTGAWTRPFRTKIVGGEFREGMLDEIKRLGFNSLRVLFSQDVTWSGSKPITAPGPWNSTYINSTLNPEFLNVVSPTVPQDVKTTIEIVDQFVDWCEELGLRIIFDLHTLAPDDDNVQATGGKWYTTATPTSPGSTTGAKREPRNEQQAIDAHVFLANRYKNRPTVCGFDLINEPHNCTWDRDPLTGIVGFYERCGNAVHTVNPNVLIICEGVNGNIDYTPAGHESDPESTTGLYSWGTWWGAKLDEVRSTPVVLNIPNKVVYSPHEYGAYLNTVQTPQPWLRPSEAVGPGYAGLPFPDNMYDVYYRQWLFLVVENIAPVLIGEAGSYFRVGGDPVTGGGSTYGPQHYGIDLQWFSKLTQIVKDHKVGLAYWAWPPGGDPDGLLGQMPAGTWHSAQSFKVDILRPWLELSGGSILVSTDRLDFASIVENTTKTLSFQLLNTGSVSTTLIFTVQGPGFVVAPTSTTIEPGDTRSVDVTFAPTSSGDFGTSLVVSWDSSSTPVSLYAQSTEQGSGNQIVIDLPEDAYGVTAVGDSLTEGGLYLNNGWLVKACFYGNQYLRYRGHFAVSGSTVDHALTIQLPRVLAMDPPPKVCVVATGTNSIYTGTGATDQVKIICETLISNNIYPILWTLPPRNDQTDMDENVSQWNGIIRDYGQEMGIPVLDAFEALRVPGTYRMVEEYANPDGLHINNFGYTTLGRYAIDTEVFRIAPTDGSIPLATTNGGSNAFPDGVFTAGSGAVSPTLTLPSGFTAQKLSATYGNWQRLIRGIGTVSSQSAVQTDLLPISGPVVSVACKARWIANKTGGVNKVNAVWDSAMMVMFTNSSWASFPNSMFVILGPQGDLTEHGTLFAELNVPSGATHMVIQFFSLTNDIEANTNPISFDVSRLTVISGTFPRSALEPDPPLTA